MKEKTNINEIIRYIRVMIGFLITIIVAKILLFDDFNIVMQWSLMLIILGITFLPVTGLIFNKFHDGGWIFAKTIGVAVSGWLMWYLSSIFLPFTRDNCIIIVTLCLMINLTISFFLFRFAKKKGHPAPITWDKDKIYSAITTELLFFIAFVIWCYLRGFKPEAYGTEKFMDYGFMTTMMRAEYMPPEDMWLSGNPINYYYVGQYLGTYLTKLTGTTVNYGYNLFLMTIVAFSISLPYSLVYNVSKNMKFGSLLGRARIDESETDGKKVFYVISGLFASVLVTLASSMHYPIYKWIVPLIDFMKGNHVSGDTYWFPNATRYIGYDPETKDKTIHEFPNYSFVLGDLHAHVINIMFVITVLAILYAFLLYRKDKMVLIRNGAASVTYRMKEELFHPAIIAIGFFIGLFNTTNFWDFPIYFVVSGAIILFSNAIICRFKKDTIKMTALHALVIIVIAELVCLPFTISFKSISSGIGIALTRSPLYKYLVLWALPISVVVFYFINQYRSLKSQGKIIVIPKNKKKNKGKVNKNVDTFKNEHKNIIYQVIDGLQISDLFMITIGFCAIGLILMPEIVYVRDIYSGDFKRANTMFKLTYQAFIMFGICMSYMTLKLTCYGKEKKQKIIGAIFIVLLATTVMYSKESANDWYGNVFEVKRYQGLDAAAFMIKESEADYKATKWLNDNIDGLPVVLEANGDSYSFFQRVSVITGLPTVMGWYTHEWLWRCESSFDLPAIVSERVEDVKTIYTSYDIDLVKELIEKYNIAYIYVGGCEREKFGTELNEEVLKSLGLVVFETAEVIEIENEGGDTETEIKYEYVYTYIIEISN